jgi:hypothetical protein
MIRVFNKETRKLGYQEIINNKKFLASPFPGFLINLAEIGNEFA